MRKIGFVGAGKAGTALGLYFSREGYPVCGYYSRTIDSAKTSAGITGTSVYDEIQGIAADSDVLFLSVPDAAIRSVADQLMSVDTDLTDKWIIHLSGAETSDVFSDLKGAYGFSFHPAMAISDPESACRKFPSAVFTIEGTSAEATEEAKKFFQKAGLTVFKIDKAKKPLYHLACVFSSNLVTGLYTVALDILGDAGFNQTQSEKIAGPLFMANSRSVEEKGPVAALTGPVERCDTITLEKHLSVIPEEYRDVYILLSEQLIKTAEEKNPDRDYSALKEYLKKEKKWH